MNKQAIEFWAKHAQLLNQVEQASTENEGTASTNTKANEYWAKHAQVISSNN